MRIRIIGAIVAVLLAIAGTVTVVLYVQGADERAAHGAQLVSVYVVHDAIDQGTSGAALHDHVSVEKIARNAVQPETVTSFSEIEQQVVGGRIEHLGSNRHAYDQVRARMARTIRAFAM